MPTLTVGVTRYAGSAKECLVLGGRRMRISITPQAS